MLERATGCLDHGRRALTRLKPKAGRSRRSLHSAFWCHGAGDIDLPEWWMALLQQPPAEHGNRVQKLKETARDCLRAGLLYGGFLDFLYPTKTLSLIRKLAMRDATSVHSRIHKQTSHSHRRFTSEAATAQVAMESELEHASDLVGSVHRAEDASSQKKRAISPRESFKDKFRILQGREAIYEEALAKQLRLATQVSERSSKEQVILSRVIQGELHRLIETGTALLHDQAFAILEYYENVPAVRRQTIHLSAAIDAAFTLGKMDKVLSIYRDSFKAGHLDQFESTIFLKLLDREDWPAAMEMWNFSQRSSNVDLDSLLFGGGAGRSLSGPELENLFRKTLTLIEEARGMSFGIKSFAERIGVALLKHHLTPDFPLDQQLRLVDALSSIAKRHREIYMAAISQTLEQRGSFELRVTHTKHAFQLFTMARKRYNLNMDKRLLIRLLSRASRYHFTDLSPTLLDHYEKLYGTLEERLFQGIVESAAHTGDAEVFRRLIDDYKKKYGDRVPPNLHRWTILLHARRGEVEKAVKYFNSLETNYGVKPTADDWRTLIACFARVKDVNGAEKWLSKMKQEGVLPDGPLLAELMGMYAVRGDLEPIQDLFRELDRLDLAVSSAHVTSLVQALLKGDRLDEAEKLVRSALSMNLDGNRTLMWNYILLSYARKGDLETMNNLHREMDRVGIESDRLTFAALMQGYCFAAQPLQAWQLMYNKLPEYKIQRGPLHYAVLMAGFLRIGKYREALNAYDEMTKVDIKPSFNTQVARLHAMVALDASEQRKKGEDSGAMSTMRFQQASDYLQKMLDKIDPRDYAAYNPIQGISTERLDEKYLASYFAYMMKMYVYGKNLNAVAELYSQYVGISKRLFPERILNPPMSMLVSLMMFHRERKAYDEVERCWYLAMDNAEKMSRRSNSHKRRGNWVLPRFQYILCDALLQYMMSMYAQQRIHVVSPVIKDLLRAGYDLDNRCWNLNVNFLLADKKWPQAFEMCEHELMRDAPVEDFGPVAATSPITKRHFTPLTDKIKTKDRGAGPRKPYRKTLVALYSAVQKVQNSAIFKRAEDYSILQHFGTIAPKTMLAINSLPGAYEKLQTAKDRSLAVGEENAAVAVKKLPKLNKNGWRRLMLGAVDQGASNDAVVEAIQGLDRQPFGARGTDAVLERLDPPSYLYDGWAGRLDTGEQAQMQ